MKASFLLINLKLNIPSFILDKESFLYSINERFGYNDIDFKKYPVFSNKFFLSGANESAIRNLFDSSLILFFEKNQSYYIESRNSQLLIKGRDRFMSIEEIKNLLTFATELVSILKNFKNE